MLLFSCHIPWPFALSGSFLDHGLTPSLSDPSTSFQLVTLYPLKKIEAAKRALVGSLHPCFLHTLDSTFSPVSPDDRSPVQRAVCVGG